MLCVTSSRAVKGAQGPTRPRQMRARSFLTDTTGTMSIFSVFLFMTILILGGLGIDMMSTELRRMKLQNTLDRAVLAAASLSQDRDPEEVVRDYFEKAGMLDYLDNVDVSDSLLQRTVHAEASAPHKSMFLKVMGVDQMSAPAKGTASEAINQVEISLVLDISGSMKDNGKLGYLKTAATEFVDTLLTADTQDRVSISLVPYSEHVAAGPNLMNQLDVNLLHNYSYCVEFPDTAFTSTALDRTARYEQVQHYQWNYDGSSNDLSAPVCPKQTYEQITPLSQDAVALDAQINALKPRSGTAIFLGMKWGAAMLVPSFRGVTSNLVSAGVIDGAFAARPVDYSAPGATSDTLKAVVLMTDGMNDYSNRIKPANYATWDQRALWNKYGLWYWAYNKSGRTTIKPSYQAPSQRQVAKVDAGGLLGSVTTGVGSVVTNNGLALGNGVCTNQGVSTSGLGLFGNQGAGAGNLDCVTSGVWQNAVTYGSSTTDYYEQKYTPAQGDALLDNICDAAKAKGIVIWTIAFETPQHGKDVMESCASSPNHFFDVQGKEIKTAFGQIANQIKHLKLIN